MPAPDFLVSARLAVLQLAVLQLAAEHRLAGANVAHLDQVAAELARYIETNYADPSRRVQTGRAVSDYFRRGRR